MRKSKNWAGNFCRLIILALGLAGLAGGCTTTAKMPQTADHDLEAKAGEMAQALYERGQTLPSFAARGDATYIQGQDRKFFRFELITAKPDKILFTVFGPAGKPAFKLASDGTTMSYIAYGEKAYITGKASPENFRRIMPFDFSLQELIALASGAQVEPTWATMAMASTKKNTKTGQGGAISSTTLFVRPSVSPDGNDYYWQIRLSGDAAALKPDQLKVESSKYGPPRRPKIEISYNSIKDLTREDNPGQTEPFPFTINGKWQLESSREALLRYEEVRLGLKLDEKMFKLEKPASYDLIKMDQF